MKILKIENWRENVQLNIWTPKTLNRILTCFYGTGSSREYRYCKNLSWFEQNQIIWRIIVDIERLSDGFIAKSDLQYKNKHISSLKRRKTIVKSDPKTSFNTL